MVIGFFDRLLGMYYVVNSGVCSWYEFVKVIFEESGRIVVVFFVMMEEYGNKMFCFVYLVLSFELIEWQGFGMRYWWEVLWDYL